MLGIETSCDETPHQTEHCILRLTVGMATQGARLVTGQAA